MYTILRNGEYLYVYRKPTRLECDRYIHNGYTPPELIREPSPQGYQYARAEIKPNYPMPAVQYRTKYDYSDLRANTVIGLMMGDFTHHWLVEYWPRD